MANSEVEYALQTLVSKIKERELESQRALNEQEVANRLLKLQIQELQNKLEEKDSQLSDANETIRALRSVTQVIAGLQDEIRALRTQLRTSQVNRPIAAPKRNPAVASTPVRTRPSGDASLRTPAHPTGSDYISQNSNEECSILKIISDSGRTTEVAVPHVKQEDPEVEMVGGEAEQDPEESVKLENSGEWDGGFEYNHEEDDLDADMSLGCAKQTIEILRGKVITLEGRVESLTEERNFLREGLEGALKLKADVGEPSHLNFPMVEIMSSVSAASDSEEESKPKRKKKDKRIKDRRARTPEDSISRYNKVLKLVKCGLTKTDAYTRTNVDRNTIVSQAPIAELAAVNPQLFKALRANFRKGDSLQRFAAQCEAHCSIEPCASLIATMKETNHLLDISKNRS